MLKLENLSYTIEETEILKDINYEFQENKIYLITGQSGSGKSTLAYLCAGLVEDYSGKIIKESNGVSLMFQNPNLQFCMNTVKEELIFVMENCKIDPKTMDIKMKEASEFAEITHLIDRELHSLSGGEKQSVSLACIYLLNKKTIILDEPFANLDKAKSLSILKKLYALHQKQQKTLIFIDHIFDHYNFAFDKVLLVENKSLKEIERPITEMINPKEKAVNQHKKASLLRFENTQVLIDKKPVSKPINFEVYKNELIAISGPSGAGKTSLLLALLAVNHYRGTIKVGNKTIKKSKARIGFVFQNPMDQFIAPTVYEEIYLSCESKQKTNEILKQLELEDKKDLSPFRLSQGQQRRLALGTVLSLDFDLVVLDEPTYGQDRAMAIKIMEQIADRAKNKDTAILFTSHDESLMAAYADRILEIERCEQ